MTEESWLRDAVSWAAQVALAEEDAEHAQRWRPEDFPQRIRELRWTRRHFEQARARAVASGALAPDAEINIRR